MKKALPGKLRNGLRLSAFLICIVLSGLSCNRDSNELAPSKFENEGRFSRLVTVNGVATARISFLRKSNEWKHSTDMLIENLTLQNVTKLGFHIQSCTSDPNYTNCDRIVSYVLPEGDTIKAGRTKSVKLNSDFVKDSSYTSIYLTSLNTKVSSPAPADFFPATSVIFRVPNSAATINGIAKTYVQPDGNTHAFIARIDGQNVTHYNISGLIFPSGQFTGSMLINADDKIVGLTGTVTNGPKIALKLSPADAAIYHISSIDLELK